MVIHSPVSCACAPDDDAHDVRARPFPFVHTAAVEVTSSCNLRCTYCMVSQPDYVGLDLPGELLDEVLTELRKRKLDQICINGHGETTMRPGWHRPFLPLVTEFRVSLFSNLARRFPADEIAFLASIDSLNLSLDTDDPELTRLVRRSVSLDVIVANLEAIRAAAIVANTSGPRLILSTGVYDLNVLKLDGLARFAIANHVDHIVFWSVVKHPDVDGATNVRNLLALDHHEAMMAIDALDTTADTLRGSGVSFEFVGDFVEVFRRHHFDLRIGASNRASAVPTAADDDQAGSEAAMQPIPNRIFSTAQLGITRDCADPWNYSQIKADGTVYPCCAHSPIGRIDSDHRYAEVLDGSALHNLRTGLLNGHLDDECRNCHMRAEISVEDFQARHNGLLVRGPANGPADPPLRPPWHGQPAPTTVEKTEPARTRLRTYVQALRAAVARLSRD